MGDDAVDLVGRIERLTQGRYVDVGLHEGVEGVDPELRRESGVGVLPVEFDVDVPDPQHVRVDDIAVGRVHHHRSRSAGKGPGIDQIDLASHLLLGRGAEHRQPESRVPPPVVRAPRPPQARMWQ